MLILVTPRLATSWNITTWWVSMHKQVDALWWRVHTTRRCQPSDSRDSLTPNDFQFALMDHIASSLVALRTDRSPSLALLPLRRITEL